MISFPIPFHHLEKGAEDAFTMWRRVKKKRREAGLGGGLGGGGGRAEQSRQASAAGAVSLSVLITAVSE